jgi:hypothetical protein
MSEVARRHGLVPAQVYKWRPSSRARGYRRPGAPELPSFAAVEITKDIPSLPAVQESGADRDRPGGAGDRFASTATLTPRCWSGYSTCCRLDDPGSLGV